MQRNITHVGQIAVDASVDVERRLSGWQQLDAFAQRDIDRRWAAATSTCKR
jgi:hypothetical protein